jgi:single-strand DNA-binding protein
MYNPKNSFRIEGNLGKDAITKTTASGTVVTFSVAVNKRWRDSKKVEHKRTDWFDVEDWDNTKQAGSLKSGTPVIIEGEVKTDSYEKNGVQHRRWTIRANTIRKIDFSQPEDEQISDANEDA